MRVMKMTNEITALKSCDSALASELVKSLIFADDIVAKLRYGIGVVGIVNQIILLYLF